MKKLVALLTTLLAFSLFFTGCGRDRRSLYDLPKDVRTQRRSDGWLWVVFEESDTILPITLPTDRDFMIKASFDPCFYENCDKKPLMTINVIHACFNGCYYYRYGNRSGVEKFGYDGVEMLYVPQNDGIYALYAPDVLYGDLFYRQSVTKTEEEVKYWFYDELGENAVSIAEIHGVRGTPTGKTAYKNVYFNDQYDVAVQCDEYDHHGVLQYADPETGLCVAATAKCADIKNIRNGKTVAVDNFVSTAVTDFPSDFLGTQTAFARESFDWMPTLVD